MSDEGKIDRLLHKTAEEIRQYVASQVETWRMIPHWALEAEREPGWGRTVYLSYTHGIQDTGPRWSYRVFVELCSGRLVTCMVEDALDKEIVRAYLKNPPGFNALLTLDDLKRRASEEDEATTPGLFRVWHDREREVLRQKYEVPLVWTQPGKALK